MVLPLVAIAGILAAIATISQVIFGFWFLHWLNSVGIVQLIIGGLVIITILLLLIKRIF